MIDELQGLSEGPEQRVGPAKPSDICEKRGGGGGDVAFIDLWQQGNSNGCRSAPEFQINYLQDLLVTI